MTLVELKCDGCDVIFIKRRHQRKGDQRHFCAVACYRKSRTGSRNPHWRGGRAKCVCQHCGKKFEVDQVQVEQGRGKHCSRRCKYSNARKYRSKAEMNREMGRRRETRIRATRAQVGSHTPQQWDDLKARAKHRCVKCRRKRKLCRDHIIPLSKGGSDRITNIQPYCRPCNSKKWNRIENLL